MDFKFIYTDEKSNDFIILANDLNNYYISLFGDLALEYQKYNLLTETHYVCLVYKNSIAVGCGSFKIFDGVTVEMKRFFIEEKYRGLGLGSSIMKKLERLAKEKGYKKSILSTDLDMIDSINFYKKLNYKIIENYYPFINKSEDICMGKKL
ncbi:MAG: GNAT family N-acetyltransferase [Methanobacteriaceae archaeon]